MKNLDIPVLNKSMPTKVYEYVRDCPGCTSRDVVADLELSPHGVNVGLMRLLRKGMLRTDGKEPSGLKLWYLSDNKPHVKAQHEAKQETVTSWPACKVAQQNPWSALGL